MYKKVKNKMKMYLFFTIVVVVAAAAANLALALDTGVMGGLSSNPSAADLNTMDEANYILHAKYGELTEVNAHKVLFDYDSSLSPQFISFAQDPNTGYFYAKGAKRINKSTDGGQTWTSYLSAENIGACYMQILSDGNFIAMNLPGHHGGAGDANVVVSNNEGGYPDWTTRVVLQQPNDFCGVSYDSWYETFNLFRLGGPDGSNDTLIFPVLLYNDGGPNEPNDNTFVLYRSTDKGYTWTGPTLFTEDNYHPNSLPNSFSEGGICRLPSGNLLAAIRYRRVKYPTDPPELDPNGYKNVFLLDSNDEGLTWTNTRPLTTVYGQTRGFPVALDNGVVIMIHDTRYGPGEPGSRALVSYDEGQTWQDEVYFLDKTVFTGAYNESLAVDGNTILTVSATCDTGTDWEAAEGNTDYHGIVWDPVLEYALPDSPVNEDTGVGVDANLVWTPVLKHADANFDVYLGVTSGSLPKIASDIDSNTYDPPGDLNSVTTYFWRVDALDPNGNPFATGVELSFGTLDADLYFYEGFNYDVNSMVHGQGPWHTSASQGDPPGAANPAADSSIISSGNLDASRVPSSGNHLSHTGAESGGTYDREYVWGTGTGLGTLDESIWDEGKTVYVSFLVKESKKLQLMGFDTPTADNNGDTTIDMDDIIWADMRLSGYGSITMGVHGSWKAPFFTADTTEDHTSDQITAGETMVIAVRLVNNSGTDTDTLDFRWDVDLLGDEPNWSGGTAANSIHFTGGFELDDIKPNIVTIQNDAILTSSTTMPGDMDEIRIGGTWTSITGNTGALAKAASPRPTDSATGVAITSDLIWDSVVDANDYDVYFGTSSPGSLQGNQEANSFDPNLSYDTTYYWRIDSNNSEELTTGDVWSFTTEVYDANITLIDDESFEGSWPPASWTDNGDFIQSSAEAYDQTYSAYLAGGGQNPPSGDLITPDLDCNDATEITVEFYIYDKGADDGDFYVDYYDGTSWDEIGRLDNLGEQSWTQYSDTTTDSQYFKSDFKVRWRVVTLGGGEKVYVDYVTVTKKE